MTNPLMVGMRVMVSTSNIPLHLLPWHKNRPCAKARGLSCDDLHS